jgi:8-oxo-dGTP diphosphatase
MPEQHLRSATLCLLISGNPPARVCLGYKKTGFGQGKYTGFGGKVEPGETPAQAAARELWEETGLRVPVETLEPVGKFTFLFPHRPDWSQVVFTYRVPAWEGEPAESREMIPVWFAVDQVPYPQMWQDGAYWLPRILAGQRVCATFTFQADLETIDSIEDEPWPNSAETTC